MLKNQAGLINDSLLFHNIAMLLAYKPNTVKVTSINMGRNQARRSDDKRARSQSTMIAAPTTDPAPHAGKQ
jgi:hypothetical protein